MGEGINRYKLLCTKLAIRIYCTTWKIWLIFYNNYNWSRAFKNCELLCCTLVTYNIIHQLYFNLNNNKKLIAKPNIS